MESLFDKLKSLGISLGQENKDIKPQARYLLDQVMRGKWLNDQYGDVFLVNNLFPHGHQHGTILIPHSVLYSKLFNVSSIKEDAVGLEDILFIDTETTGLSGGTGTMIFLVGLGYFSQKGFITQQYFLDDPIYEMGMLQKLNSIISKYKVVISYNGSSFDIPLLKTRFLINRVDSPFSALQHLDLLHLSRKLWKLRLQTVKLRDVETEILNFIRAEVEVPSWMVPQIYFDFIRNRDARPLKGVFYHNCMDVLSLAAIFIHVSELLLQPDLKMHINYLDLLSIAKLFKNNGLLTESATIYRLCLNNGIPEELHPHLLFKFGIMCKKLNQFDMALEFWEMAYHNGYVNSTIELSKYFEHILKDVAESLSWIRKGQKLLGAQNLAEYKREVFKKDLQKREARLVSRKRYLDKRSE